MAPFLEINGTGIQSGRLLILNYFISFLGLYQLNEF